MWGGIAVQTILFRHVFSCFFHVGSIGHHQCMLLRTSCRLLLALHNSKIFKCQGKYGTSAKCWWQGFVTLQLQLQNHQTQTRPLSNFHSNTAGIENKQRCQSPHKLQTLKDSEPGVYHLVWSWIMRRKICNTWPNQQVCAKVSFLKCSIKLMCCSFNKCALMSQSRNLPKDTSRHPFPAANSKAPEQQQLPVAPKVGTTSRFASENPTTWVSRQQHTTTYNN